MIKLAGRGGAFDLEKTSVFPPTVSRPSIASRTGDRCGIGRVAGCRHTAGDAVQDHHQGHAVPDRWGLPDSMRDDTGVIFASAFPGLNAFAEEMARYYADRSLRNSWR